MKKKILIIGGGTSGLNLICKLCKFYKDNNNINITLIDKKKYFIYKNFLYDLNELNINKIINKIEYEYLSNIYKFNFIFGEVKKINHKKKVIILNFLKFNKNTRRINKKYIKYNILVICIGKINNFNIKEKCKKTFFLDNIKNSIKCLNNIKKIIFEINNNYTNNNNYINKNIIIIGSDFDSINILYNIYHYLFNNIIYENIYKKSIKIILIESSNSILPLTKNNIIKNYIYNNLIKLKINILLNTKIKVIYKNYILISNNNYIKYDLIISPYKYKLNNDFIKNSFLKIKKNKILLKSNLLVKNTNYIFSVGKCCEYKNYNNFINYNFILYEKLINNILININQLILNKKLIDFKYKENFVLIKIYKNNFLLYINMFNKNLLLKNFIFNNLIYNIIFFKYKLTIFNFYKIFIFFIIKYFLKFIF